MPSALFPALDPSREHAPAWRPPRVSARLRRFHSPQSHDSKALDAGRNEVYVREASTSREWLCSTDELKQRCEGQPIAVADTPLRDRLKGCNTTLHFLHAADSLSAVLFKMREGVSDVALTDANYVRQEIDIYRKPTGAIS